MVDTNMIKKIVTLFFAVIIGLLIMLIVGTLIALHFFLKPENIKALLVKEVYTQTKRQLTIGQFSWSIFPTLHVDLNQVTLGNPPGFQQTPFITINKINVGIKVAPLFHHAYEASSMTLSGINVNLIKNSAGLVNWQGQIAHTKPKPSMVETNDQNNGVANNSTLHVIVPEVNIENININYNDEQARKQTSINNLNFYANHIQDHQSFPFKLNMEVNQNEPLLKVNVQSAGHMRFSEDSLYLENVNFSSLVKTNKGTSHFQFENLNATIKNEHGVVVASPLSMQLYGGTLNLGSILNLRMNSYIFNAKLTHFDAQAFLKDVAGYDQFTGLGSMTIDVKTKGQTKTELISHLNGNSRIQFENSQYLGVDIGYLYRNAATLLLDGKFTYHRHDSFTKVGNLAADFLIQNGVVTTQNLSYVSPVLKITAAGNANLNNQQVNMKMNVIGQKGSEGNLQDNGPLIPFNVTGSFAQPKIKADMTVIHQEVKKKIVEQVDKALKKIHVDKIEDKLKGFLNI